MEEIVKQMKADLASRGLDICEPFPVSEYNKTCVRFPLPTYGRQNALGLIIGSTKSFWPSFERYIRSFSDEAMPKDPIDSFHEFVVNDVIKSNELLRSMESEARYDWNAPRTGKFVHVQTAGHLAGFAYYDQQCFWSCHPDYGFWFTYRAAVVFDVEWEGPVPQAPLPVLDDKTKAEIQHWTQIANEERWQNRVTRLKIRDACSIGRDTYRYEGECFNYFFPIEEPAQAVIDRIRASIPSSSPSSSSSNCCGASTD